MTEATVCPLAVGGGFFFASASSSASLALASLRCAGSLGPSTSFSFLRLIWAIHQPVCWRYQGRGERGMEDLRSFEHDVRIARSAVFTPRSGRIGGSFLTPARFP